MKIEKKRKKVNKTKRRINSKIKNNYFLLFFYFTSIYSSFVFVLFTFLFFLSLALFFLPSVLASGRKKEEGARERKEREEGIGLQDTGKTDNKIKGILLFFLCPGPFRLLTFYYFPFFIYPFHFPICLFSVA